MSEPRDNTHFSVNQWVIDSYLDHTTFIGRVENLYASTFIPPSVHELTDLNPQHALQRLRECLQRPEYVEVGIALLAQLPPDQAVALLRKLATQDHPLWGAVLLCRRRASCRPFLAMMTEGEQANTVQSAIEHLWDQCQRGGAVDSVGTLLGTDGYVAAVLLAKMPPYYVFRILAASQPEDRLSLLNSMLPQSVYKLVAAAGGGSFPTVCGWVGAMRPDRIAAALQNSPMPRSYVVVAVVKALNAAQGLTAVAELLVAAEHRGSWVDDLFSAIGPLAAVEVLEYGGMLGRNWILLLQTEQLIRIARAVDAATAARLLEYATHGQMASTLPKLPPYRSMPILANLTQSAAVGCLTALDPKDAARLLGLGAWRVELNLALGELRTPGVHELRTTLEPVARARLLALIPPTASGPILAEMSRSTAAKMLPMLPADNIRGIIAVVPHRVRAWLRAMPLDDAIDVLGVLDSNSAADLLAALPSLRAIRLLAMTLAETCQFEEDNLRAAGERAAAAVWQRQVRQSVQALSRASRHAWRLLLASQMDEAEPMAILMHAEAVNLWRSLDPHARERLEATMSDAALNRLLN